jgi:hypothetical protein
MIVLQILLAPILLPAVLVAGWVAELYEDHGWRKAVGAPDLKEKRDED